MDFADETLRAALASLLPPDRKIIELHATGETFEAIGVRLGLSRSQACRRHADALRRLKSKLKAEARADKHRADDGEATTELL